MMEQEDRRAAGVQRVPVERVVEICGREPGIPAFEAESVELSGRGMHVRTPYLPDLNAPLVCRLEHENREIVVEGVVAWRHQTDDGGEFGVKFTALDSRSVDVLKTLCGLGVADAAGESEELAPEAEPREAAEPSPPPPLATPGQPVKLHIDGLGSPMKARVRRGSKRRVHVGSNLEFLKVGRSLEIENIGNADRLSAYIDSVSVSVDPQTEVPQLVVTLRYEGVEDTTPEPSVLAAEASETPGEVSAAAREPRIAMSAPAAPHMAAPHVAAPHVAAPQARVEESEEDAEYEETAADEDDADIDRFVQQSAVRERLETFAKTATVAARSTGRVLARVGGAAAVSVGQLARQAGQKFAEVREQRSKVARRRTTSPAASLGPTPNGRRLRPQSGVPKAAEAEGGTSNLRKKRIALATAGLGVVLAGAVMAFSGKSDEEAAAKAPETAMAEAPAASVEVITPPAMKIVAAPEAAPAGAPRNAQGMVADVPLFGPTPMATMEPAPLEPPADDIEASAGVDDVPDESFDEPAAAKVELAKNGIAEDSPRDAPEEPAKPQVWGNGKLHLPFVHRIKLDDTGTALEGAKKSNGFTVFLPNRKLLETGKAIARRDDRIVEVRTSNETRGARVTFVFQGQVPAYKVRLKGDYVEFFISSPEGR